MGRRGSGSTRYSGRAGGEDSRKHGALEGDGNQYWPVHSNVLAWRTPLPVEKPGRPPVHRVTKIWTLTNRPCARRCKVF